MPRTGAALVAAGLISAGLTSVVLTGCASADESASASRSSGSASEPVTGTITVFAAASLTESFTRLAGQFEDANPGVTVTLSFASSSALATQVVSGAPADVFASAGPAPMQQVVDAGAAAGATVFALNLMAIAVPPDNPGNVTGVQSLASASVTTALCQPQVPCGSTAQRVFSKAGVAVVPVTLEPDVKSVLSKVLLNEVDAGVVYATDVRAAGSRVAGIQIPAAINASTAYPIATLTDSGQQAAAAAFVAYVLSPAGQRVLAAAGFASP
jgi:molybdate transport system substrate-binding protein